MGSLKKEIVGLSNMTPKIGYKNKIMYLPQFNQTEGLNWELKIKINPEGFMEFMFGKSSGEDELNVIQYTT